MALVQHYVCDICKEIVPEADLCDLNCFKANIRGKEINIENPRNFCCPACFMTYISELISNGNGLK